MKQVKPITQLSLFGVHQIEAQLDRIGDPLVVIAKYVDFNIFRTQLETALDWDASKPQVGRPRYDMVAMFKMLFLQHLYGLSDQALEFQITDRASFRRFLNWGDGQAPDATTFRQFREELIEAKCCDALFQAVLDRLNDAGFICNKGVMTDAVVHEVPIRQETPKQKEIVKQGELPEEWSKPAVAAQKDLDATWGEKRGEQFFGYKNHILADACSKVILKYTVTGANVHDSQATSILLRDESLRGQPIWGDSAYHNEELAKLYKSLDMIDMTNERAYRNHPLNEAQEAMNRIRSTVRARVEHIFGYMDNSMNGLYNEVIGFARNSFKIGMTNITFNLCRMVQLLSGKAQLLKV